MDPSYGGGYTKPTIETADASTSSPSSPTNKKETGEKKSSGKDETGTTGTTGNGEPVKKLSTVDFLPPNATTPPAAQPAKAQANAERPSKQRRLADDKKPEPKSEEKPDSDDDLADIKARLDKIEQKLRELTYEQPLTYEPGSAGQPGGTRRKILEEADKKPENNDKPKVSGGAAENDPFKAAAASTKTADETADTGGATDPYLTNGPSTIWNGMIYPIRKFRFAGVAWYQGESNFADPTKYACLFPATITGWRAGFENPSMAWAFVQLHAYDLHDWSEFRNAQVSLPSISVFLFP